MLTTDQLADGVSIVTPCYKCPTHLESLLVSLASGIGSIAAPVEIIVVDTSPKGTMEQLETERLCDKHKSYYILGDWRSVARSRNVGVKAACFNKIFFVDADCVVLPDTLKKHVDAFNKTNEAAGTIGLTKFNRPMNLAGRIICATPFTIPFRWVEFIQNPEWGPTCNLFVRVEAFKAVGGFDERFLSIVGGEDVDFGWRVSEAGFFWKSVPSAVVEHDSTTWDSWLTNIRRVWRYGIGDYYLATVHRERCFWEPLRYPVFSILVILIWLFFVKEGHAFAGLIATGSSLIFGWIYSTYVANRSKPIVSQSFFITMLAELFVGVFDFGHFWSALIRGDFRGIFSRVKHADGQVIDCRNRMQAKLFGLGSGILLGGQLAWVKTCWTK